MTGTDCILAMTRLATADYVILVGYFLIMLGIGVYFWRYMKGMRQYFSGQNQIPWWLSGVSYYMTSFSAFLFVAYSEVAYKHGLTAVYLGWTVAPAVLIGAIFLAWRWRRARIDSPVEYLEERFGLGLRQTFGWANIPLRLIDNGLRLYATGMFVGGVIGLDVKDSVLYCGLITLAYTFAGGLWAVTVTDFVQFVVMIAGAVILVPLSIAKIGGMGNLFQNAPPEFFRLSGETYTVNYLFGWFLLVLFSYNTSFGLVQRYYCVRDEREARKVGLLVTVLLIVGTPLFFLPALAARQYLSLSDDDAKNVYAILCSTLLPAGALGLLVAAMFSATMSSLSGDYNVVAAVLTNDVYKRLVSPGATEKKLVLVGRVSTVVVGLVPVGIALFVAANPGGKELFRKMVTVFSVALPPIAIPMLAGLIWRRCTNRGALIAFVAGLASGFVLLFYGSPERTIAQVSTAVTLAVIVVASLLDSVDAGTAQRSRHFYERMQTPVEPLDPASLGKIPSPWGSVGISLVATSLLLCSIMPWMRWDAGGKTNLAIGVGLLVVGAGMTWQARRAARPAGRT